MLLTVMVTAGQAFAAAPPRDTEKGHTDRAGIMHALDGASDHMASVHGNGYRGNERWLGELAELDLAPAQHQAIQEVTDRYHARGLDLAQRATALREQMLSVSPNDTDYADSTSILSETAAVLAADTVKIISEFRSDIHAVLTPEQRQRLRDRIRQDRQRWDDWREQHKAPP